MLLRLNVRRELCLRSVRQQDQHKDDSSTEPGEIELHLPSLEAFLCDLRHAIRSGVDFCSCLPRQHIWYHRVLRRSSAACITRNRVSLLSRLCCFETRRATWICSLPLHGHHLTLICTACFDRIHYCYTVLESFAPLS